MSDLALIEKTMSLSFAENCQLDYQWEHIEKSLKKLNPYVSCETLNDGNWFEEGDQFGIKDFWALLKIDGEKIYVELKQPCTMGEDPYYFTPEILKILSEIDYNKLTNMAIANFDFKGENIIIYKNNTAELKDMLFENTEAAINYLL